MRLALIATLFAAGMAQAQTQDWNLRDTDQVIPVDKLTEQLTGKILTFYDNGTSEYYDDGRYTYTYGGAGGTAYGYWKVTADSTICIDYINGWARCDMLVESGERLVLITKDGDRFPIRP